MRQLFVVMAFVFLVTPASAAQYALVDQANAILEYREFGATPNDPSGKNWRWLSVVVTDPAFDPDTQVRSGPVVTVEVAQVTRVFSVRAKTAAELDDDKAAEVEGASPRLLLRVLCDHENRIRLLNLVATLTLAQCKATFKALLP